MMAPFLFAIGGAHVDRRGQVTTDYVPGASNPGVLAEDVGGGVFNALRNAVRLGTSAALVSVRGGDAAGEAVARAIAHTGIADRSAVFLDRATASYTALLDRHGELIAGLADMGLYENAFPRILSRSAFRQEAGGAAALLCDANIPEAGLAKVFAATGAPVHGVAISPAKVVRYRRFLPSLSCLFLNAREAASLVCAKGPASPAETVAALRAAGLGRAVVTAGAAPVIAYDGDGAWLIDPPAPRAIADVTGAGDAIAGTTIAATMEGMPFLEALRLGMAAAMLTIESPLAVAGFKRGELEAALSLVPRPRPMP